ncbi:hypothetical protein F3I27_19650 [Pantoea sp. Bo_2]|uniref:Uncharacterized protein n=1 Tax=Candidatus Pantoea gossypiicola TaxID=2608008 RepID=A0AB34CFN2_9GAMM|nr:MULTISPECIES: hypothetical protein [Pantoea]KAA5927433.1 hypothetical protein F3I59_16180 [Pantoea sp. VH_8]KAA5931772.1 hypothetical protein F3I58_16775 [Pantoea sp. VH_4]KAA5939488.1 hypothetical protein F3I57_19255 [Pantoea sp. VH_3]KAA5948456.1 hypothetical protein F3I56_20175 [Pantoea sp. VH_25]KAA5951518.1 hypothetical protein F3I55_19370 [Pantoea sp. VH_24]
MRELKSNEIAGVSGGSLTSVILDFFKQIGESSKEKTEWVRPESIPEANPVSGTAFGMGIVGVAAAVVFGLLMF